jgi:hypothetical protein
MKFNLSFSKARSIIAAITILAVLAAVGCQDSPQENNRVSDTSPRDSQPSEPQSSGSQSPEQPQPPPGSESPYGQIAVHHLEYLSENLGSRFAFSAREKLAADWIVGELTAMGHPRDNIYVQEFAWDDVRGYWPLPMLEFLVSSADSDLEMRDPLISQNVILTVPGQSDEFIIVGAHYDTVFNSGASDNGSGTALLLESAQRMLGQDNYYTIKYVFWGAEEVGLFGASVHARSLTPQQHDNVKFVINADVLLEGTTLFYMGGYDTAENSWDAIARAHCLGSPLALTAGENRITQVWDEIAADLAQHDIELVPRSGGIFGPSDQLAYLPYGHTVMFMMGMDTSNVADWESAATLSDLVSAFMDMSRVLHSNDDCFRHINATWHGLIEANMGAFSRFLEEILLADYS